MPIILLNKELVKESAVQFVWDITCQLTWKFFFFCGLYCVTVVAISRSLLFAAIDIT